MKICTGLWLHIYQKLKTMFFAMIFCYFVLLIHRFVSPEKLIGLKAGTRSVCVCSSQYKASRRCSEMFVNWRKAFPSQRLKCQTTLLFREAVSSGYGKNERHEQDFLSLGCKFLLTHWQLVCIVLKSSIVCYLSKNWAHLHQYFSFLSDAPT